MSKLEKIKTEIEALPSDEVARLREWLDELDAQRFDQQIEADAASGKLDRMIAEAKANHAAGRSRKLS